jgi:creatinine amidohydrolase/Fe(II)-dependent formamide hydrolase-like protein
MMGAQVAITYGLFCERITFDGIFEEADRRFILDMMENTAREIYVNKFLFPNEFLKAPYQTLEAVKQKKYCNAEIAIVNTKHPDLKPLWKYQESEKNRVAILSSGGKDSLLTYGLMKEIGMNVHPIYVNEAGRHWFTAVNAYRMMQDTEPNAGRVWCNSDRIFPWMVRQMPFIREDFANIRADNYPIRLWTVAVFLFGVLPLTRKRNVGHILIGDEYDTTIKANHQGITHYSALFDQSKYFDNALTRYYTKKGWNIFQYSALRSLGELLILKTLVKRYPELQRHQISCHAAHEREGRIYPCGNCEKCRRVVGMLAALDEDPGQCGYTQEQIKACLQALESRGIKQIGSDAAHLYALLLDKGLIQRTPHTEHLARPHPHIERLRFDNERSMLRDIPAQMRQPILNVFLQYALGVVQMENRQWKEIPLTTAFINGPLYPFEFEQAAQMPQSSMEHTFEWEKYTWPEIEQRLEKSDTAILPCGAIEQHGPHLPLDVDYYDAVYLARKVAAACSHPRPFVLPPVPYGVSYHHEDFKGTISVRNETLGNFIYDIGMNLAHNGIRKLIILNGHGDNVPTLTYAAQMINRDAQIFVCVETGETSDGDIYDLIDSKNDIHAGEIETSTTMAVRPEVVRTDKMVAETMNFGSAYLDYTSDSGVPWYVRTRKISNSGVMGDPTKATAEKGKKMWQIMIAHLVEFVEEIKKSRLEDLYQRRY